MTHASGLKSAGLFAVLALLFSSCSAIQKIGASTASSDQGAGAPSATSTGLAASEGPTGCAQLPSLDVRQESTGGSRAPSGIFGGIITDAPASDLNAAAKQGYVVDFPTVQPGTVQYVVLNPSSPQNPGNLIVYLSSKSIAAGETEGEFLQTMGLIVSETPSKSDITERVFSAIGNQATETQVGTHRAAVNLTIPTSQGVRPYLIWWTSGGLDWSIADVTATAADIVNLARSWECQ